MSDVSIAEKLDAVTLPVATLEEALPQLRRPFAPNAVQWKIQSTGPAPTPDNEGVTWALCVGYIDARLAGERLNAVVAGGWTEEPMQIEDGILWYKLTVLGQSHIDVGEGQGSTTGMKAKGLHSDALKRAAVRFGVGVSLYAMPKFFLKVGAVENDDTLYRLSNKKAGQLKDRHHATLRTRYEAWLDAEGADVFGPYLDHGDAPESVGEAAEQAPMDVQERPTTERIEIQSHSEETTEPVVTAAMRKKIWAEVGKSGLDKKTDEAKIRAIFVWVADTPHSDRIPRDKMNDVIDAIKRQKETLSEIRDAAEDPEVDGHTIAKQLEQAILDASESA
jgi:hypothetical protein